MEPLVSILVPAFNSQAWIAESLASAVAQTWKRKEIIVVDDGSPDRTLAIARTFASKGVSVMAEDHRGAASARNSALAASHGDYVQWLDADDVLAPDKIERQLAALDGRGSTRTLLSAASARFMYRRQRLEFVPTPLWCDLSPVEWLLRKMGENLYMQTATWLVSRELTEAAGPWDTRLLGDDDGEYFCRVLLKSEGVQFVPDAKVFVRRVGSSSLSHLGRSEKKIEAHFRSMQLHVGYLRSLEDSARVRSACATYLQTNLIVFYPDRPDIVKEAEELAAGLNSKLEAPRVSWKYAWIAVLFGWGATKRTQLVLRAIKWSAMRSWDKALFRIENLTAAVVRRLLAGLILCSGVV